MKKVVSLFAALTIMVSMLAINVSAAADIEFSISDAEGKPGDIVEVSVYVDKNIGTWAMNLDILYDSRCFDLVAATNGKIFLDGEHEPGVIDDSGTYKYYASNNEFEDVTDIGTLITLQFKILKAAPNGEYSIDMSFPDGGEGWFFGDVTETSSDYTQRSVELVKKGIIKVSGSDAESLPETTKPVETEKETDKQTSSSDGDYYETEIVTEFVTDKEGEVVTDAEGEPLTTEVPIAVPEKKPITAAPETTEKTPETEIVYVTDAEGEQVTEPDGEPVTEIVIIDDVENDPVSTVVIIVCIVAVVAAAALIAFVVVSRRKNDDGEADEEAGEDDNQ